ncbi:glutathione S-transferase family protein [Microvirga splendida]|uniref:Glutathione S-transferase n=1 Tax=Microvirga splendida TaxID=2795727 RepID=A0ABS0XUV4_9HYPH|nr:glutathione S-transferase family protein [Microvirga splendida]MBJ6123814.1 glutathione S-transferase [Microvirga splendida]
MRLYVSPTSPYARLACVMCLEARLAGLEIVILDPWQNPPDLLEHNPAGRVPALVLEAGDGSGGQTITESLVIADFAARRSNDAERLWFQTDAQRQLGGICFGIIDAAAAIMAGRMVTSGSVSDTAFDSSPVAHRRQAAMNRSLDRLEQLIVEQGDALLARPGIAAFLPVIVVEYLHMRFGDAYESADRPYLSALVSALKERPALASTRPLFTKFTPFDGAATP